MKVTMSIVAVLVLALTFGVAYAETAMSAPIGEVSLNNGITYSDLGLAADCDSVRGAGAGGVIPSAEFVFMNGVTQYELALPGTIPTGLCAGASRIEAPSAWVNNGITMYE